MRLQLQSFLVIWTVFFLASSFPTNAVAQDLSGVIQTQEDFLQSTWSEISIIVTINDQVLSAPDPIISQLMIDANTEAAETSSRIGSAWVCNTFMLQAIADGDTAAAFSWSAEVVLHLGQATIHRITADTYCTLARALLTTYGY